MYTHIPITMSLAARQDDVWTRFILRKESFSFCFSCLFVCLCKIQADGRKFLDRFKSYFGSKICEVHIIYRLQPKSATKREFFSYIFVFDCQFESAHVAL